MLFKIINPNSVPVASADHTDPVCGMTVDPADAAGSCDYSGKTYHFCSPSCLQQFKADPARFVHPPLQTAAEEDHRDPVCGMHVDPNEAAGIVEHAGHSYYFCSTSCVASFKAEPQKYLHPQEAVISPGLENIEYTCPMDPEVRQVGPGSCPKCGMALEPVNVTPPATRTEWTCPMHPQVVRSEAGSCPICGMALEPRTITVEEDNPELRSMTRRFWASVALTSPILALMVSEMLPGKPLQTWLGGTALVWVQFFLATPVVLWGGLPFFVRGWQSVVNRHLNMFTLIALGTGAAYLYSVAATLFPAFSRNPSGTITRALWPSTSSRRRPSLPWCFLVRCSNSERGARLRALYGRFLDLLLKLLESSVPMAQTRM